jgi:hypothetical protein
VSEDRAQNTNEDRDANVSEVEGHSLPGAQVGAQVGQNVPATDDDEPDFEGHALIGANAGEPTDAQIGANTSEPTDANIA